MNRYLAVFAVLTCFAWPAGAFELTLPAGSRQVSDRSSQMDSYALPVGPFRDERIRQQRFEGQIERQTWRIDGPGLTTLQVLAPLRNQIAGAGFDIIFQCRDAECGGFDFRFATEVVPAPDMYVDIHNFRFLSAMRNAGEAVTLLVSRSRAAAFVQIVYINRQAETQTPKDVGQSGDTPEAQSDQSIVDEKDRAAELSALGHVILDDLVFATGAGNLKTGQYKSLNQLAAFLKANPDLLIALVGHTDSVGTLERNIALSKRRAESVRTHLIQVFGITPTRIQAEGMGYLAPVASNLTVDGRKANRRVEAILLSDG